jgi:hypothetical protein
MPESSFFIWINPERRILVLRSTTKGRYNSFSVVLMVLTSEGWIDVSRFDAAHGTFLTATSWVDAGASCRRCGLMR